MYIIAVILLESLLRTLIPWHCAWIPPFISNCISIVFCFILSIILRPRPGIFLTGPRDLEYPEFRQSDMVETWDMKKTLLIQWPGKTPLSLAYEESYDTEQSSKEELYQDQVQPGHDDSDVVFVV